MILINVPQAIPFDTLPMADPFSIAASVVGLASFGLQVTNGIAKYLDAIECRKSELESARNNLNALTQVLYIISKHANHLPLQTKDASPPVVQSTLQLCTAELEALGALLAKLSGEGRDEGGVVGKVKKARRKLAYPFDQDKLAQMGAKLGQSVQTLHLALQVLHMYVHRKGGLYGLEESDSNAVMFPRRFWLLKTASCLHICQSQMWKKSWGT